MPDLDSQYDVNPPILPPMTESVSVDGLSRLSDSFANLNQALSKGVVTIEEFTTLLDNPAVPDLPEARDLDEFIDWMAIRFVEVGGMDSEEAKSYARMVFEGYAGDDPKQATFLHPEYDWTESGAYDLADEDMSYWEG